MTFGDEIWDEEEWEAFLRQSDERIRRYMDLLFGYLTDNPPPAPADAAARKAWEERLRRFLEEKGFEHDAPLALPEEPHADEPPGREPPDGAGGDAGADLFLLGDEAADADEALPQRHLRDVPVYRKALDLSTYVLDWSNALPGEVKDSTLVQFCTSITQVPANIAKGHGIGYERDMLGGNIACAKRGLAAANSALEQLRDLRAAPYMDAALYRHFYEQTFELRNELGLYVQELRARFNLGID